MVVFRCSRGAAPATVRRRDVAQPRGQDEAERHRCRHCLGPYLKLRPAGSCQVLRNERAKDTVGASHWPHDGVERRHQVVEGVPVQGRVVTIPKSQSPNRVRFITWKQKRTEIVLQKLIDNFALSPYL